MFLSLRGGRIKNRLPPLMASRARVKRHINTDVYSSLKIDIICTIKDTGEGAWTDSNARPQNTSQEVFFCI